MVGDVGCTVKGLATIAGGIALGTGGAVVSSTGAGAVIGVPAVAVSAGAVAAGVAEVGAGVAFAVSGFNHLGEDAGKMREAEVRDKGNNLGKVTTKQSDKAAKSLGYSKVSDRSHGQPVYKNGNKYITPDVDSHNGGVWKMADSVKNLGKKSTRMGTYDANLVRIGD